MKYKSRAKYFTMSENYEYGTLPFYFRKEQPILYLIYVIFVDAAKGSALRPGVPKETEAASLYKDLWLK